MQVKVLLASFLATILAVGVIATPTPADVVDSQVTPPPDPNDVVEDDVQAFALGISTAAPDPLPTGPTITPGDDDTPTPSDDDVVVRGLESLEKRTPGCFRVTTGSKFTGISGYTCKLHRGHCANFTLFWSSHVSSIRPDPGTFCIIYPRPHCKGKLWGPFGPPGYGHLGPFNDNIGSIKCWWW